MFGPPRQTGARAVGSASCAPACSSPAPCSSPGFTSTSQRRQSEPAPARRRVAVRRECPRMLGLRVDRQDNPLKRCPVGSQGVKTPYYQCFSGRFEPYHRSHLSFAAYRGQRLGRGRLLFGLAHRGHRMVLGVALPLLLVESHPGSFFTTFLSVKSPAAVIAVPLDLA